MIKKTENCLYCGEKMESVTAKKKFCSPLHRVYYNREKERGTLGLDVVIKGGKPEFVKYDRPSVLLPALNNAQQIAELEEEMKHLGDGSVGKQRKKFLQNKIYELKKQLK